MIYFVNPAAVMMRRFLAVILLPATALYASGAQPAPVIEILGPSGQTIPADAAASLDNGTDFGNQAPGAVVSRTFTIRNAGDAPLILTGSSLIGSSRFMTRFASARIEPGGTHAFDVSFNPAEHMVVEADFNIFVRGRDPLILGLRGSSFDVNPAGGPVSGGNRVTVYGDLPADAQVESVRFGGTEVEFRIAGRWFSRARRGSLILTAPAAEASGPADIEIVTVNHGRFILSAAYRFDDESEGNES